MPNLCHCGCGKSVTWNKKFERWNRYLHGHCKNNLGKHHSEESNEKNRQAHLGRPTWNKGKTGIFSKEVIEKIKAARAKQVMATGRKHSEESKTKNRMAHLGKSQTEESNRKRSIALMGKLKSAEHKKHISESKIGEYNPCWQGGISKLPYTQDWQEDLKDAIRKRDGFTCQLCGVKQPELNRLLAVHHIDYDKENCDPRNLISLCNSCHAKTGYERRGWKIYFGSKKLSVDNRVSIN